MRLLRVPYRMLFPAILIFCTIGIYSINNAPFDVAMTAVFALVGYWLIKHDFEPAPMLLGFVLGPLMEENLRRAMLIARGDPMTFVYRPISATLLAIAVLLLVLAVLPMIRRGAMRCSSKEKRDRVQTSSRSECGCKNKTFWDGKMTSPRVTRILVAAFAVVVAALPAAAQDYPNRGITIIVPFAAGGPTDVIARIVSDHMSKTLGQQIVIENVVGAGRHDCRNPCDARRS